ncbi:MAG: prepilin-type N-terminal cleavage/methylation domain-containing protein [Deltaproteobacteria bacterium]|nr:prepilin-type N-terminal cleavage/methylation domain-containing protein [Deltaproteobacteria bacterium]
MRPSERGFTLIGLMIATACVGILVLGVQGTRGVQERFAGASRQQLRATLALENELARLRAAPTPPISGRFLGPELRRLPEGHGERHVILVEKKLWQVLITVRWRDAGGKLAQRNLVSILDAPRKRRSP